MNGLPARDNFVTDNEGLALHRDVIDRLQHHSAADGWGPEDVDKDSVILVCPGFRSIPRGTTPPEQMRLGGWVMRAFQDFLGLPMAYPTDGVSECFVVDHDTGGVVCKREYPFDGSSGSMTFPPDGYVEVTEYPTRNWRFEVFPDSAWAG